MNKCPKTLKGLERKITTVDGRKSTPIENNMEVSTKRYDRIDYRGKGKINPVKLRRSDLIQIVSDGGIIQ